MAAAVSTTPNLKATSSRGKSCRNPTRPPLLVPSDAGNNVVAPRRSKPTAREVTSRYMSTSSSSSSTSSSTASNSSYLSTRRSASPLATRTTVLPRPSTPAATPLPRSSLSKRSQSAERRRPATPRPVEGANGISAAAKVLMSSSKRSLSASFQGESFSTPISKTKHAPPPNSANATVERRSTSAAVTHGENARPAERNPWPARSRQVSSVKPLSTSVDLGSDMKKLIGRSGSAVRALRQSLGDRIDQIPSQDKLEDNIGSTALKNGVEISASADLPNLSILSSESPASDTESVCSDSNSGSKDDGNVPQGRAGARGIVVPARVWQETNNRLRRLTEPVSPLCRSNSLKSAIVSPSPRENLLSRGLSPLRGCGLRPASPSRMYASTLLLEKASPSRAMASPSRVRNAIAGTSGNTSCSMPSVLCFTADVRRGKTAESRISDAHLLRLMYNRHLQWRFANSRAEAAMSLQRNIAETSLYNAWQATSDLRLSVCNRRLELARMRLKLKLLSILKGQMMYLEEWGLMEKDHSNSLLGSTESLRASTLRLPIVCGAMADMQNLKDTMCTAFDVLQAMASSICSLMSKMEQMNSLFDEVVSTSTSELAMLDQCRDVLSALAAFQVKDCSLRAHSLQLKQVAPSLPIET